MSRNITLVVVLLALSIFAVVASPSGGEKRVINVNNVHSVSLEESLLVMDKMAVNETTTSTSSKGRTCYPVPYSFCMGCPIGCSDSCFYYGTWLSFFTSPTVSLTYYVQWMWLISPH
jgi:hypothetical protein